MNVSTRKETITPAKARALLACQAANRPVSDIHVRRLAGAIKAGAWRLNGETLKLNSRGELIDGQHRCHAVIMADAPIESFVTRGLEDGDFDTIDIGKTRTISNVLSKHGNRNATLLSAVIGCVFRRDAGALKYGSRIQPRHDEALAVLHQYPDIVDSLEYGRKCQHVTGASLIAFMHWAGKQNHPEEADRFCNLLASGENLSKTDPATSAIYALRSRLLDNRAAKSKLPNDELLKIIIKAWNAMLSKTVVKTLKCADKEEFPEIH